MPTVYPAKIDSVLTLPPAIDTVTPITASSVNTLAEAIFAIESALGTVPQGVYTTVSRRLGTIEAIISGGGGGGGGTTVGGDLFGLVEMATVVGLQGVHLPPPIGINTVLTYSGGAFFWTPHGLFTPTGTGLVHIVGGVEQPTATLIVNADVDSAAAITYNKLNLAGAIVNNDIASGAAISYNKLNLTGDVVNSDIATNASIAGTKITPAFGSQNISTTGTISSGGATFTSIRDTGLGIGIVHSDSSGFFTSAAVNLGTADVTGVLPTGNQAAQTMGGDISGTTASSTVIKLQGNPISSTPATAGQFLVENASANQSSWITITGDVVNSISTPGKLTVTGIQGNTFTSGSPTKGQFVVATSTTNYGPVTLSGDVAESATTSGQITVTGIQQHNVASQILNASTDGYVLTWDNGDGYWLAKPSTSAEILVITFQPGGTPGPFTYTTEATLIPVLNNLKSFGQPITVIFDLAHSSGSYTFTGVYSYLGDVWIGLNAGTITFANNTLNTGFIVGTIPNIIDNIGVVSNNLFVPTFNITPGAISYLTLRNGGSIRAIGQYLFNITSGAFVTVTVQDTAQIAHSFPFQVFNLSGGGVTIYLQDSASIADNTVNPVNSSHYLIYTTPGTSVHPSLYNAVRINGFYNDRSNTGLNIPAFTSGIFTNTDTVLFTNNQFYYSDGTNWISLGTAGGDLSGLYPNPTVVALQHNPIKSGILTIAEDGYALVWSGTQWYAAELSGLTPGGGAAGDLFGSYPNPTVVKIQTNPVTATSPTSGQYFVANNGASELDWVTLSGDVTSSTSIPGKITVVNINGTSVPATPSANQVLVATSGSAAIWEQISNAQVSATAAIAGTKITPAFGSQNISTTGTIGTGSATFSNIQDTGLSTGIVHSNSSGNFTSSTIVNADVSATAAIAVSKLASGTSAQILLNNSTPTPTWTTVSGDATVSATGTVTNTGLRSISVPSPSGTNTVLTYNAGAYSWSSPTTGITQLTGDVTAGPGSGSVAATVVALQNYSVSNTAPTTGNTLGWNGSSWTPSALNLAGGSNYVTGLLPTGNQVAQTMGGDVTGTTAAAIVVALQTYHVSNIAPTDGYVLTWDQIDGYWLPRPSVSGSVPTGTGIPHIISGMEQPAASLIVDADVDPSAAIAYSKLNLTNSIVNSDVATAAAIAGTKITPSFGSQNISTTGTINSGAATFTSIRDTGLSTGVVHSDSSGNFTSSAVNLASGDVTGILPTGNQAVQTMGGDVTGTTAAATVVALQNNPVLAGILNSVQDGYVLTWNGTEWLALPGFTTPAGTGIPHIISGVIQSPASLIVNADVDPAAAIAGTKINPAFGSQNISTTGTINTGAATVTSIQDSGLGTGIVHSDSSGNLTSSAVNLASADVTGVLSTAHQANQTMGGDVSGTTGASTVVAIQSNTVLAQLLGGIQDGYALTWNGFEWLALPIPNTSGPAGGDLGGTYPDPSVIALQGNPIVFGTLGPTQDGYVATWNGSDIVMLPPGEASFVNMVGDVDGLSDANTIQFIQSNPIVLGMLGVTQDGYVMTWNGADLVMLPPSVMLVGDANGPSNANVVDKIHGSTVPIGGSLVTGNVLQVNGSASLGYAPINLAGGSNFVSGVLPNTNQQAQTMGGDISGTTNAATVSFLEGNQLSLGTLGAGQDGYVVTWNNTAGSLEALPLITGSVTLHGDITGPITATLLSQIRGNPIDIGILGAAEDGYALIWSNLEGMFIAAPATNEALLLEGDVTGTANNNVVGFRKSFLFMGA